MDPARYHALKMTVKRIGGGDYLFIEAGGFSTPKPRRLAVALVRAEAGGSVSIRGVRNHLVKPY